MIARIRSFLRMLVGRREFERSMNDEMRFHIEAYADDLVRSGMTREAATRLARVGFGPQAALEEDCRSSRGVRLTDEFRQDIRYAFRQLRRSPVFALAAIVSLALGIGANIAIFGLMDAVLFRMLPVEDPSSLYFLGHGSAPRVSTSSNYPLLARYQESGIFASVTSTTRRTLTLSTDAGPELVSGEYVSGNFHSTLGVPFTLGRGFSTEPDRPDGRGPVAVISDAYWMKRFARAPDVIGKTLIIGGRPLTIVGVTAPGYSGVVPGAPTDITVPLFVRAMDGAGFLEQRDRWISVRLIGRLRPDRTAAQTSAAVNDLFRRYWAEPENEQPAGSERAGALVPAGQGALDLKTSFGTPLWLLFGMVVIVLVVACTNVANLFLARAAGRSREIAVRVSLGAGRGRLVRQMVTESALLALVGGVLGLAIAVVSMDAIVSLFAVGEAPLVIDARLSARVLTFTAAICVLCCLGVGVLPAFRSSRVDVTPTLKETPGQVRGGRWPMGRVLVATQLALSFLVVSVSALFLRSVLNMRSFDAGFSRQRTLLVDLDAGDRSLGSEQRAAFFTVLETRLRALPGVSRVAYVQRTPLDHSTQTRPIDIPEIVVPKERRGVSANVVTPEFFGIFGIGQVRGGGLSIDDKAGSEPVAVVDEALVRAYFGSYDPLGRRVFLGADREPFTIVGVVQSSRFEDLREEPPPTIYTPLAQSRLSSSSPVGEVARITVAVQTFTDLRRLEAVVRAEVRAISPRVIVSYVRTMEQQFSAALLRERLMTMLSVSYGALALLLALVGLYGVTAFGVARRGRDIGVRMALGATRRRVLSAILAETAVTATSGIVIGGAGSLFAARLVAPFLFGIEPNDPWTLGGVVAVLAATTLLAGYVPGRRAASIDPVRALRAD